MPEAVIVSAARSPIGRANKGSLKDLRPDDLDRADHPGRARQGPGPRPARRSTTSTSAAACPAARAATTWRRVVNVLIGMDDVPGATITRYCSSSVQTTRMAFHAIKAGEGDVFISAGVETVSRFAKGTSDHWPDTHNPLFADAEARTDEDGRGRPATGTTRARTAQLPDIYIAMGQTAENVARLRGLDRKELDEFGVRSQNLAEKAIADGFWAREITPVTTPDGTVVTHGRRPPRRRHLRGDLRAQAGLPSRRRRHRRQLLRRSTTAPPRSCHVRHQGRRARPHPARADRRRPASAASPPRSWASARSRRPSGRWPTPA